MNKQFNSNILGRYQQAQSMMQGFKTSFIIKNDNVFPHWIENSQSFWYTRETENGTEFRLVDAAEFSNVLAFDHQKLASVLTKIHGQAVSPENLPIEDVIITLSPLQIRFQFSDNYWLYDSDDSSCEQQDEPNLQAGLLSPDAKKMAFVREHNLWIQDVASGEEIALTQDGTENYSYASSTMNWSANVNALWSPDSSCLLTVQLDARKVNKRPQIAYVPQDNGLCPQLSQLKAAYPGDKNIELNRLIAINTNTGQCKAADHHKLLNVQIGVYSEGLFTTGLGWWSSDNRHAFFIDVTRGSKTARVVKWDTVTGNTQVLFEESVETYIRLAEDIIRPKIFLPLPDTNELIWYSERSGWAHLYLYDLNTGKLKHQITDGQWLIRDILHYDATKRELLIQTASRDASINPYYRDICRLSIDSGDLITLKSDNHDHIVYDKDHYQIDLSRQYKLERTDDISAVSPCGQYVVTTYSRVDTPPVSVLINRNNGQIFELERADVSGLPADWHWPEPAMLKGADGKTDIYAVVFRPPGFSPDKQYAVVDLLLGGRQIAAAPIGSFDNQYFATFYEMAALAALGFIVVGILGRGTPYRDKVFQDHNFGMPGQDDDLEDHIAGLHQLATLYPYFDLKRVGLTCMEGAENVVYGALKHSDFYKVTVSHYFTDPRFGFTPYELFSGIINENKLSKSTGPEHSISSFNGRLLLIHGVLTIGSEPFFRLVEALQKSNKDFDMLCLPNLAVQVSSYTRRRGWDYLVTHLQCIQPPHEFKLVTSEDMLTERSEHSVIDFINNAREEEPLEEMSETC